MKDSHIAWIAGAVSWVVLLGGTVGGPMAYIAADKAAFQRTLDQRGLTADVAATMGDVATLKIPKGFVSYPNQDEFFNPADHGDPDAVSKTWSLGERKQPFWQMNPAIGPPPPAATLYVTVADPQSNVMEMQRLDFEGEPFSTVGPVAVLKMPVNINDDEAAPTGMRYVALNAEAGYSADLTLAQPNLYTDAQARDLLVSVLGSLQVTPSKLEALLAGPRQRMAEQEAAKAEIRAAAYERLISLLGMKETGPETYRSADGDVLVNDVLWMKIATRPGKGVTGAGFQLIDPLPEDLAAFSSYDGAPLLDLVASGQNGKEFWSVQVSSAAALAENGPNERTDFFPDPLVAAEIKPGEITLWRMVYIDEAPDVASVGTMETMVVQTIAWRTGKAAKPWIVE